MSEIVNNAPQVNQDVSKNIQDQKPINNTVPPATSPEPKPDDMAAKFAALAKKERYARMLAQQNKARIDALTKREAAIAEREKLWDEEFKSNPLEALKKRNLTYQDLTNAALNEGKFDSNVEIKSVKDEIQRLRQENEQKEKKAKEDQILAQKREEAEAVESFKEVIRSALQSNPEKYELTNRYDPQGETVYALVDEHWNRSVEAYKLGNGAYPKILSKEEALELTEEYYESEIEKELNELPKTKRFQSKWASKFQPQNQSNDKKSDPKSSVTLNNQMNTSSAPSFLPQKTEDDRIKRALAALGQ